MLASGAFAQPPCAPRDVWMVHLNEKFGETLRFQGITDPNRQLVEVFVSKEGDTWTMLMTYPGGLSCVIGSGNDWRAVTPELLKPMGMPI